MSELEKLMQELCPNGVEYKPFGEVATIVRGASPRPIKNFVTTDDDGVNWIKIGDVKPGSKYITETAEKITPDGAKKSRFVKEGDFILSNSMSFGRPYIMKTQGCIHDGWLAISNFDDYFIPDFLYHLLNSNKYQRMMRQKASFGGAVQNLNADIVRELDMPIVPLEIQRAIVRILDTFTELTTELTAELAAELTARKKQYEYYRMELFNSVESYPKHSLISITDIKRGVRVVKKDLLPNGEYPVYQNCLTPMGYYDAYNCEAETTYVISAGAAGEIGYCKSKFWAADDCLVFSNLRGVLNKFVYHYLITKSTYIKANVRKASIPRLSRTVIEKIEIPVPPIEEQQRIVDILDRFDALCNDISAGLPAEIEARQKQYEYYRDKLLTFQEMSV